MTKAYPVVWRDKDPYAIRSPRRHVVTRTDKLIRINRSSRISICKNSIDAAHENIPECFWIRASDLQYCVSGLIGHAAEGYQCYARKACSAKQSWAGDQHRHTTDE